VPSALQACREGDLKSLKHLIDSNMGSVHSQDKFGMYPLMHAVHGGHFRVVRFLVLGETVDVMAQSKNGNTAMHYAFEQLKLSKNSAASERKWEKMIRFLVENGAEKVGAEQACEFGLQCTYAWVLCPTSRHL